MTSRRERPTSSGAGAWTRQRHADRYHGTSSIAWKRGASLTVAGVRARRVAVIATACPRSGTVEVRFNGALLKRRPAGCAEDGEQDDHQLVLAPRLDGTREVPSALVLWTPLTLGLLALLARYQLPVRGAWKIAPLLAGGWDVVRGTLAQAVTGQPANGPPGAEGEDDASHRARR